MPKVFSYETREEFLGLFCSGMSMKAAGEVVGVSAGAGLRWWRECGLVELRSSRASVVGWPVTRRRRPRPMSVRSGGGGR
jgi:hypothetical protein